MMSTSMGKRGFFYEAWENDEVWTRFRSPVTECPRVSPEFLDSGVEVFGRELVEPALVEGPGWPLDEKTAEGWVTALAMGKVVIAVDLGKRQDPTAIAVLERRDGRAEAVARYLERMGGWAGLWWI